MWQIFSKGKLSTNWFQQIVMPILSNLTKTIVIRWCCHQSCEVLNVDTFSSLDHTMKSQKQEVRFEIFFGKISFLLLDMYIVYIYIFIYMYTRVNTFISCIHDPIIQWLISNLYIFMEFVHRICRQTSRGPAPEVLWTGGNDPLIP